MIPIIGEEFAKKYSIGSKFKLNPTCPNCGCIKNSKMSINTIYKNGVACPVCGDGISYPNKFMNNLLKQLNINFETEKRFNWCKYFNTYKNKEVVGIYDFYIPSMNLIIEMDGGFHTAYNNLCDKTKEESQYEDLNKDMLANENNLKVIRIDCDYKVTSKKFEYIKNCIINSELSTIFDFNNINWNTIEAISEKSLVKEICDYYNNNKVTINDVNKEFGINKTSIRQYLRKGTKLGWCNFIGEHLKIVEIFKDGQSLGVYNSLRELEKNSIKDFGINLRADDISETARGIKSSYKGFTFKYVESEKVS